MRWTLTFLALIGVVAGAGCGGGGAHGGSHAQPVAVQLRDVLQRGFRSVQALWGAGLVLPAR